MLSDDSINHKVLLTMRIVQAFTEQHPKPTLRTIFSLMSREVTDKASTRAEEQVGIVIVQTRKGVEREAIHGHKDGNGEQRTFIEADPMDVVVIGHGLLNYFNLSLYMDGTVIEVSLVGTSAERTPGDDRTNVGSMKTIGADTGCPGSGSNQMRRILSLHIPFQNEECH
jgi:hypothetical protein